jgi:ParB family chromosome partitioning protein
MSEPAFESPRRRLGRGLSALLGGGAPAYEAAESAPGQPHSDCELRYVPIGHVARNPWQPRKDFEAEALGELAASIKEHGVLQPLLVREIDGGFQLIAGERRWLAAQKAGLETVPCRVLDVVDKSACEFALEENLKRKDLSDLEKAHAFKEYLAQFQCSIEELGKQLSMSRSAVSNILRLLELCEPVRAALQAGQLTSGHARALLPLAEDGQLALCARIQSESLSVRQTEQAVKQLLGKVSGGLDASASAAGVTEANADPSTLNTQHSTPPDILSIDTAPHLPPHVTNHVRDHEEQLRNLLGTPVTIRLNGKDSGQIIIDFASNAEFDRILGTLRSRAA